LELLYLGLLDELYFESFHFRWILLYHFSFYIRHKFFLLYSKSEAPEGITDTRYHRYSNKAKPKDTQHMLSKSCSIKARFQGMAHILLFRCSTTELEQSTLGIFSLSRSRKEVLQGMACMP
jgi:hypothetical protein